MPSSSPAAADAILGGVVTAVVGGAGWVVRRWVNGLGATVDAATSHVGEQFDDTAALLLDLYDRLDAIENRLSRIEGALKLPAQGAWAGPERRKLSPAQRAQLDARLAREQRRGKRPTR